MKLGDLAQVKMGSGSSVVGQSVVEFSEEGFQEAMATEQPKCVSIKKGKRILAPCSPDYTEKLDQLIKIFNASVEIMEDIRYFSVPWYIRAYQWIRGKF